ncbi:hypothetical protein AVEN_243582-1 [Araneus ventricosus]|uniref:Uncharacterized protein n=1 Tax=Araneus ventricosus TaxID=182803 RepID=A0A4Y2A4U1_ARAVE|nr:hypothetical protein AVEN_243582-1 [Araneus ventricosus]
MPPLRLVPGSSIPPFPLIVTGGGGLVVRCRLWGWSIPGSKPDSTEQPPCTGPLARQIIRRESNVLSLVWCGSLERWCQLRCRPRHLTVVQNYDVRPKIALVLLQSGTLTLCAGYEFDASSDKNTNRNYAYSRQCIYHKSEREYSADIY